MSLHALQSAFRAPATRHRPMPLLRINDAVDEAELRRQIRSLREQGCGGIYSICERFGGGCPEPFVSEWWWKVVGWMAQACAEEGLEFWAYDDEDWPSGSVGGQLPARMPEHNWKYLHAEEHTLTPGAALRLEPGEGKFIAAAAWQTAQEQPVAGTLTALTPEADGALAWTAPGGTGDQGEGWTVAVYTARPGKGFFLDGLADLMDQQACAQFIEDVYASHAERVGQVGGARLMGYFTDEPCLSMATMPWQERFSWYPSMPWTPRLAETFAARHGYDWTASLPHLYHEFGPESLRFRCHHWDTCSAMYAENYFGQIYRFCEERGLLSSGHLMREEEFENVLALQGGNTLRAYRQMHIPGVDWIHPFDAYPRLTSVTFKAATSMAHLKGRERTWCESFAGGGWGTTFQEMRRIVNWEHVNGINMQIPITFKYSQSGPERTRFYPGGITWQQPYWDLFRAFADYEARVCALTQGGGHVAQLALLYPSVDLWAHCWERELLEKRSGEYNALADLIRAHGYDYDILDDDALQGDEVRVEQGRLKAGDETFEVLVVPRVDAVSLATLRRAVEFVSGGGRLLFAGGLPRDTFEDGAASGPLRALLEELAPREGAWVDCGAGQIGLAGDAEAALALLRLAVTPDLRTSGELRDVIAMRRSLPEGDLYLIFNDHPETREIEFSVAAQGAPEIWNPETGGVESVSAFNVGPQGTTITAKFAGYALLPFVLRREGSAAGAAAREVLAQVAIEGPFAFRAEATQQRPEHAWNYTEIEALWTSKASDRDTTASAPARIELGDWATQGLPFFSGIGHYEVNFELPEIPEGASVWIELGRVAVAARVTLNGREAGLTCFEPHRLEITALARSGVNRLQVAVANTLSNYYAQFKELESAALSDGGDFPERRVSGLLGPVQVSILAPGSRPW